MSGKIFRDRLFLLLLGRFHQTLEYWKIIHFSTFWHKFTFYVSFIVLHLLLFFHMSQYPPGFAYLIFSFHCSFWWLLLPLTNFVMYINDYISLLYFFYHLSGCMSCCLSTRKIFSFNIARAGSWSSRNIFICVCC